MKVKQIKGKIINIISILLTPFPTTKKCLNAERTIENLITQEKSIIRFGDGEFRILLNKRGIEYQQFNPSLQEELRKIIKEYSDNSPYILAMPSSMFTKSILWYLKNKKIYIDCFGFYRFYFRYFMNKKCTYGDAFCFSLNNEKIYSKLWSSDDIIIFVHRDKRFAEKFQKQYNIETKFIKIPSKEAYSEVESTIDRIKEEIIKLPQNKKCKVLISAGPAAKSIVYSLSKNNIIAYDTGHCWDEPLMNPKGD